MNDLARYQASALMTPANTPDQVLTEPPRWQLPLPGGNLLQVILAVDR